MNLQIAGLAATVEAVVTVAGSGMTQFVTASRMIPNLAPGAYTVTAEPVLTGQSVMAPTAATQTIQVVEKVEWAAPNAIGRVLSFGEDALKELYAITASGKIYRVAKM